MSRFKNRRGIATRQSPQVIPTRINLGNLLVIQQVELVVEKFLGCLVEKLGLFFPLGCKHVGMSSGQSGGSSKAKKEDLQKILIANENQSQ